MKKTAFGALILGLLFILSINNIAQDAEIMGDANGDGIVNILDLVLVAWQFGKNTDPTHVTNPDVNGDGTVNGSCSLLVKGHGSEIVPVVERHQVYPNERAMNCPTTNQIGIANGSICISRRCYARLFGT